MNRTDLDTGMPALPSQSPHADALAAPEGCFSVPPMRSGQPTARPLVVAFSTKVAVAVGGGSVVRPVDVGSRNRFSFSFRKTSSTAGERNRVMATRSTLAVKSANATSTTAKTILRLLLSFTLTSLTGDRPTSTANSSVSEDVFLLLAPLHSGSAEVTVDLEPVLFSLAVSLLVCTLGHRAAAPLSGLSRTSKFRGLGPSLLVLRTGCLPFTALGSRSAAEADRLRCFFPRRPLLLLLLTLLVLRLPCF